MASVLTITPQPSKVGDTVAVATTGSDPSTFPTVPIYYDFSDLTPFFPLSPYEGMTYNVLTPSSMNYTDNGAFCFLYSQSILYDNEPIDIDFVRNNTDINTNFAVMSEDGGGTAFFIFGVQALTGSDSVRIWWSSGFVDVSASPTELLTCHFENNGSGTSTILVKSGTVTIYSVTTPDDLTGVDFIRLGLSSDSGTTQTNIADFSIIIHTAIANWSLTQDAVEITSGTTTGGAISYDHTAQASDNGTDWKYIIDGVDSNIVTMLVESGASEYIEFTTDSDTQFQVQAVSFKPDITINYKLVQLSKGTYTSIDRGSTTDRYSTTLVISGSLSYIESLIRELTLLRSAKKSVLISSPYVNIFGDNVDYSSDISTVVGFFGKQKTVQLGKQEITVELIATDLSFVGVDTFPNALQCLQNTWSGYAKWNTKVNETYNRNNYFVDREKDEYLFTGRYIMTIEENQKMLNFWKNTRGVQFAINDDTFGAVNMFGATMTGDGNVIIKDYKYSILSPTHRAVTIELVKVG